MVKLTTGPVRVSPYDMDITEAITLAQLVPRRRMKRQVAAFAVVSVGAGLLASEYYKKTLTKSLRHLKRWELSSRLQGLH